jgi:hypothetical protein
MIPQRRERNKERTGNAAAPTQRQCSLRGHRLRKPRNKREEGQRWEKGSLGA